MARINIEDSIFKDKRFFKLAMQLGSRTTALGAMVEAFVLAQEHYLSKDTDRLIPFDEWDKHEIDPAILKVGLAEKRDKGIYVCGSENQFAWLVQRSEAGKHNNHKNQHTKGVERSGTVVQRNGTEKNGPEPLTLSPSLSLTQTTKKEELKANPSDSAAVSEFIKIYVKAFQNRYPGARPELSGKVQGQIKTFLKDRTLERACDLIQVFLQMEDRWFITKSHDFSTFMENLQKISIALDTGREPGGIDFKQVFGGTDAAN